MPMADDFLLGIVEGFYGRPWSWPAREAMARWLPGAGLNTYLYAPKGDAFLRSRWREDWPAEAWQQLQQWAAVCQQAGLRWGLGLSPLGTADFRHNRADQALLKRKLQRIAALQPCLLAILFDDIPGSGVDAGQQLAVAALAADTCPGLRLLVCPSYYSHDPRLAEVFGPMPEGYLADLGRGLDSGIDIFWTGQQVCSERYTVEEFEAAADLLRRAPVLWDNYPVNDGRLTSPFLHLRAFQQRPAGLRQVLRGHLANPMNQAWLSRLPLASLPVCYGYPQTATADCSAALLAALQADIPLLQDTGLEQMSVAERRILEARYQAFPGQPAAEEVLAWLAGDYRFDPDCLTG